MIFLQWLQTTHPRDLCYRLQNPYEQAGRVTDGECFYFVQTYNKDDDDDDDDKDDDEDDDDEVED